MRIILIVGLPASGKSFLLKHFPSHFDIYDDLDKIEDLNFNSENIVICHPSFCRDSVLEDAMIKLNKMFNFDHIECYYFENDLQQCLENSKRIDRGDKKVTDYIYKLSHSYYPDIVDFVVWSQKIKEYDTDILKPCPACDNPDPLVAYDKFICCSNCGKMIKLDEPNLSHLINLWNLEYILNK